MARRPRLSGNWADRRRALPTGGIDGAASRAFAAATSTQQASKSPRCRTLQWLRDVSARPGMMGRRSAPDGKAIMAGTAASDEVQPRATAKNPGRRRASGIYGAIVTAAILAAVGGRLPTAALVVSVVVTLLVYWVAEEYAELLGEQVEGGVLPTWAYIRGALSATWPMVSASYVPLLALVLARLAGASASAAANVGLAVATVLLAIHGWSAGRSSQLRGRQLLLATSVAAALGLVMIALKDLVLIHLH
jgi:hypothetical protein